MRFVWEKDREKRNNQLVFSLNLEKKCDKLVVCAVDSYRVFLNDKFACYGPDRTAAGYVRPKVIKLDGVQKIEIDVISYGIEQFSCDYQPAFFGAELYDGSNLIYNSTDFSCYKKDSRIENMPKYSRQRAIVEGYDFTKTGKEGIEVFDINSPTIISPSTERADYKVIDLKQYSEGVFEGFQLQSEKLYWYNIERFAPREEDFDVYKDFISKINNNKYYAKDFTLDRISTGFIQLDIEATVETEIFCAWEEILIDNKWIFHRSSCNDFMRLIVPKGKTTFIAEEPFTFKLLKVISNNNIYVKPSIIKYENETEFCVKMTGNQKIKNIFDAGVNSYRQNALDIFTDCPARERAGWLCDSFFMAKTEKFLTNENIIEKEFIENYLLSNCKEIPDGMLPMCFPSEHGNGSFIPNWALWFCLEVCDYYKRTQDHLLVDMAKEKVYKVIDYFNKNLNEYGLIEDLNGWVFVEWSICNSPEYVKGVNFPTNMLFSYTLKEVGILYDDKKLIEQSKNINNQIINFSFDGKYFSDNAIRENGILKRCGGHLTETCQYYALFCEIISDKHFIRDIVNNFGPLNKEKNKNFGKSNMFIGNYLRFLFLDKINENSRILDESIEYFSKMANTTGTLWENDTPSASCCHGFTSIISMLLVKSLVPKKNNKDCIIDNGIYNNEQYNVKVEIKY